eukprot:7350585-Pyramimonas_sp.AAC.1
MAEEAKLKKAQETQAERAQQNGVKAEAGPDFPNVDEAGTDEMHDFLQASGVNVSEEEGDVRGQLRKMHEGAG